MNEKIQMVDLGAQYKDIKEEIDTAIQQVIQTTAFIAGPDVQTFAHELAAYHRATYAQPVANGTDALQIALMSLDLESGDEVIVPAFAYAAAAEVIALLGLNPVLIDVEAGTFNLNPRLLDTTLSERTRAIIPVHLFGQSCDMEPILRWADKHQVSVIEDNAQAIGTTYIFTGGHTAFTGTMGMMGCTSFFPSKNLGCYGDGGAIITSHDTMAERIRMIANHGQRVKYRHECIGCNSRLDTLQAAILRVKLRHLNSYIQARQSAAQYYDAGLGAIEQIILPQRAAYSTHTYHQYTIRIASSERAALREHLSLAGISTMIYYPYSLDQQPAFAPLVRIPESLSISQRLSGEVLSLPMHTHLSTQAQDYIIDHIKSYFHR